MYVWGNTRLQQGNFSSDMKKAMKKGGEDWQVKQLEASNQFSAIVTEDGKLYLWGNTNMADIKISSKYKNADNIDKVALTDNEYIVLLKDGTVAYIGTKMLLDVAGVVHIPAMVSLGVVVSLLAIGILASFIPEKAK